MLKDIFTSLAAKYTNDYALVLNLWSEIEKSYSGKKRHYHNLTHLQNMYSELLVCRPMITDWDTIVFSIFYHDIVYKATSKDNEEKSAALAVKCLESIHYSQHKILQCSEQIIATKNHEISLDADTNILIDADMAVLGSNWTKYSDYCRAVRKEYAIYPDFLYNPGRIKVLQHFLSMENLFNTAHFRNKYETVARENIAREVGLLI